MQATSPSRDTTALVDLARAVQATGYEFVTPTPATHARVNARPGSDWARNLRDVFGWSRPFRDGLLPDRAVVRAVDIGCGAGPGAILIARDHPLANVFAVDINDGALALTRANAVLAGVKVEALHSDLLSALPGSFDLIVANPPYLVDPAARAYRHGGGEWGGALSLAILDAAIDRLAPGGTLLLYTGAAIVDGEDPLRTAAATRLAGSGLIWSYREVDPDVFGEELDGGAYATADRIAAVVLTARKS